jgi:hypothetical protein
MVCFISLIVVGAVLWVSTEKAGEYKGSEAQFFEEN